jgi:hypothetical protein
LKFQALENLIGVNGAFCLVEKKKKERGEKEKVSGRLSLAHRVHNALRPTFRGTGHVSQVHTPFSL